MPVLHYWDAGLESSFLVLGRDCECICPVLALGFFVGTVGAILRPANWVGRDPPNQFYNA